ncbi:transglycosylase SLT domain-containing protein [Streptomyces sp. NPDC021100]|uniref:aggregation-promoting factor C-terminal-like domain-containing protein n=1 Tax=Streptomyces sp. NPDC021100 TaxID=3365114 RepID=UPI00378A6BA7
MSRISVRGFAVASATAVTTVGAVVGVAQGDEQGKTTTGGVQAAAADTTLLAELPAGQNAVQTASLTEQADTQVGVAQTIAKKEAEEAARKQAAEDASAKKEAAEAAAKKEAEEKAKEKAEKDREKKDKDEVASRSATRDSVDIPVKGSYSAAEVQAIARQIVPADQFQCFSNIVNNESSWDYTATNASSGAYGLVQALPAEKMSSAGADWRTNPATQIKWGLSYMNERYHSPCGAWSFWQANSWY